MSGLSTRMDSTTSAAAHRGSPLFSLLDPTNHPWVTRRWVVLGDPGSGKTTLLRHLACKLAADPDAPTPVFASLPRLIREGRDPLAAAEEALRHSAERADGLERALENEGQGGRLTLLLDGLDEVADDHRTGAERLLRRLDRRFPGSTIIVSSRPVGYRKPLAAAVEVELLPLDRGRRLDFLARWFARRAEGSERTAAEEAARSEASAKLPLLEEDPDLWELSGNPLYLTLMAMILEADQVPERNRTRLYAQIFDLLLEGRYRNPEGPEVPPLEPKPRVQAALRYLAFSMTEDNRDAEPVESTVDRFYREEADGVRRGLERKERWRQSLRVFLNDVARRSGIYADHDGPTADWRFWHRTFREALAAERLAEIHADDGEGEVLDRARKVAGNESRWAEPFALLTGQVEDPDALVKALLGANRDLGLRAIATAPRLHDDTLRQALEITEDRDERAAVYRRIPELLGEGDRSLRLLDRLRRRTRDGDDLFFLHLAVEETARRFPDSERQAQALLARLFDHIEPPPAGMFETVTTCEGSGPLWRLIPAGSFLMGSPEGVGDERRAPPARGRDRTPVSARRGAGDESAVRGVRPGSPMGVVGRGRREGPRRPPGGQRELVRRRLVLPLARPGRRRRPWRRAADRRRVGVRLPRRDQDRLLQRRRGNGSVEGRLVREELRSAHAPSGTPAVERLEAPRPPRTGVGMDRESMAARLPVRAREAGLRPRRLPRAARWVLAQPGRLLSLGRSGLGQARLPGLVQWVPRPAPRPRAGLSRDL